MLSALKPAILKEGLTLDLACSHQNLRKEFNSFSTYEIELTKAFQIVHLGPSHATQHSVHIISVNKVEMVQRYSKDQP